MLTSLISFIPLVANVVVNTSAGIAIDSAVKMIVPIGMKTAPAFAVKMGTNIAAALIGAKIAHIVVTNVEGIIETVQDEETEEVTPAQEDN